MKIIPIERAREHCRTDGDDDALLEVYCRAAEHAAAQMLNRGIFIDQDLYEQTAADAAAMSEVSDAEYDAAIAAAKLLDDARARTLAMEAAERKRDRFRYHQSHLINGVVATPDIEAAILLILGHLYENRSTVATGTTAVEVPMAARALLWPHRRLESAL